jgi:hypothetical protein
MSRLLFVTVFISTWLGGCLNEMLTTADGNNLVQHGAGLSHCQEVARTAPDGGHVAAYDACTKEGGL